MKRVYSVYIQFVIHSVFLLVISCPMAHVIKHIGGLCYTCLIMLPVSGAAGILLLLLLPIHSAVFMAALFQPIMCKIVCWFCAVFNYVYIKIL